MNPIRIADWTELANRTPTGALVGNTDLVIVRNGDDVSVLYGRCLHRGALLADGSIVGDDLVCGVHGWDYRFDTGVSAYKNEEVLERFAAWVEDGGVFVDGDEIAEFERAQPQPWDRGAYQGAY